MIKVSFRSGRFLTLVFVSIAISSFGIFTQDVFAMGPSSCYNQYNDPFASFIINNGTQTFDALASPGVTFNVNTYSGYNVTFVMQTPSTSSGSNSNPGDTWYSDDTLGYENGHCIYVTPNQNVTISVSASNPHAGAGYVQSVLFGTAASSSASYNVRWITTSASPTAPQPPTGLTATVSSSQINLSWTAPSSNGGSAITNYNVYRGTSSGTETLLAQIGNVTTYTDSTVTNGQEYFYKVTAVNSVGESPQSNEANATPAAPATVSSAPQNLQATEGNSQVTLSWAAPTSNGGSAITGYNVYKGTTSGGESSTPVATGITSTSYNDTTVTNGQAYYYYVTAVNSVGTSSPSNEVSATTTAPATAPQPPTGLAATAVSSSQINLSWTAPTNNGGSQITGYMIERSNDTGTTWSTISSNTGSTNTTYNDTGLAASTAYTYRVSAINSVGTSSPSNTSSATTRAATVPPPAGITLNSVQSTSGTTSSSNQITLANFNVGTGNNRLLVVGIEANNNDVASITFGGVSLTKKVESFINNDAEFWYLKGPSGTGDIVATMNGPTQVVVGAYSFSGVNQTSPLPTSATKHNTNPNSPNISITTKFSKDWVLDLPSIYGGSTLGSPTCTQQWNVNVPNEITGASSSAVVSSPGAVTCKWTASSPDLWDDAAVEIKASG